MMSKRFKDLALIWAAFIIAACSSNPDLYKSLESCSGLKPGEACSIENQGGESAIEIKDFKSGEEYVVVVQSFQNFDQEKDYQLRFRMTSNISSAGASQLEKEIAAKLRRKRPHHSTRDRSINSEIALPNQSLEPPAEFFIPDLSDYSSLSQGESIPRFVRTNENPSLKGSLKQMEPVVSEPGTYELLLEESYAADNHYFDKFSEEGECIGEVVLQMFDLIGRPLDLNSKPELEVLVSTLEGGPGFTIGLFNKLDRFKVFQGENIPDSNYGEFVYLSPEIAKEKICATTAHELQHMINFDYKVVKKVPREIRDEMQSIVDLNLKPEHDGLNEAYSYLVEILTGRYQNVYHLSIYPFLKDPSLATYSLPMAHSSVDMNLKSRGLNTLFLLHALRRAKGSFDWRQHETQKFLQELILSPQIGFENFTEYFNESRLDLFEHFYRHMALSLFDPESQSKFLPESQISEHGVAQGFNVLSREANPDDEPEFPNSFHPVEMQLPFIGNAYSWVMRPEGVSIFRLIVPDYLNSHDEEAWRLHFSGTETPFAAFVVRVR